MNSSYLGLLVIVIFSPWIVDYFYTYFVLFLKLRRNSTTFYDSIGFYHDSTQKRITLDKSVNVKSLIRRILFVGLLIWVCSVIILLIFLLLPDSEFVIKSNGLVVWMLFVLIAPFLLSLFTPVDEIRKVQVYTRGTKYFVHYIPSSFDFKLNYSEKKKEYKNRWAILTDFNFLRLVTRK